MKHPADTDERLARRARGAYLAASRELDPATVARLRRARETALGAAQQPSPRLPHLLLPAGAFAVAVIAAVLAWSPRTPVPAGHRPVTAAAEQDSELPPDADSTDPQLYQNLDFYDWLASTDRPAPAARR